MSKLSKKTKIILIVSASVLLALLIGAGLYFYLNISKMYENLDTIPSEETTDADQTDDYEADEVASGLPEITLDAEDDVTASPVEKPTGSVDILLLGVDNRNNAFTGRTDTMIFMRVDMSNSKIKMVSLMRDTLVKMDGHPRNKLNTAYRFGRMKLLKSTLKDNFGLTPDYYVMVNFYGMEDVIDALGGVEINVKSKETSDMNISIKELNKLGRGKDSSTIKKSGVQNLNGRQAVAYMRIRHVGSDGDAGRIKRQQTVLSAMFKKAKGITVDQIPGLIDSLAKYVRTDIPISEMLKIANAVQSLNIEKLQTYRFPKNYKTGGYNGISVVKPSNLKSELKALNIFLDK